MRREEFLIDIVALRLLLIFFLIFYHSFVIYTGGWELPFEGFPNNIPLYYWMGYLSHGFRLETMVFISGILFGYVITKYPERLSFNGCVIKKAKRILLPSIFFSILYYLMFYDMKAPWYVIAYKILNGCGHLWFLPMIFWCFICCYLIVKITPPHWDLKKLLMLTVVLNLIAVNHIPFRVGSMMIYFVYFYLGYAVKRGGLNIRIKKTSTVIGMITLYIAFTIICNYIKYIPHDDLWQKIAISLSTRLLHLFGALSMVIALYSIANFESLKTKLKKYAPLITLSGYCYGVYIYQQFILKYLYYNTQLPFKVSAVALPWIGLVITLFLSLLLCHFTLKTKFGRYLIG
ncbi:MAG: acyltransferase [Prevotella sp.]|nr:acyltransferase [Prevotella sp.]